MALTSSTPMDQLSLKAPYFKLLNIDNKLVSLDDFKNKEGLLVMFICNHCPYVQHIKTQLSERTKEWMKKNIGIVGINSNDPSLVPEDSFENMALDAKKYKYTFPYLIDSTQDVAKAYKAQCTPDFFAYFIKIISG